MRADSDFVAYTNGEYNIEYFRKFLLSRKLTLRPEAVRVIMRSIGSVEESTAFTQQTAEEYELLKMSALTDVGY